MTTKHIKKLSIIFTIMFLIGFISIEVVNAGDFVDRYNRLKNDSQYSSIVDKMYEGGVTDQDIEALLRDIEREVDTKTSKPTEDQLTAIVKSNIKNNPAIYNAIVNEFSINDIIRAEALFTQLVNEYIAELDKTPGGSGGGGGGGAAPQSKLEVKATSGGTINKDKVTIKFPANFFKSDIEIKVEKLTASQVSKLVVPEKAKLVSDVMEITKNKEGSFDKAVSITLPFDKAKVDMAKYDLSLYWLNEKNNRWVELDHVKIDAARGIVTGEIDHFTKFAVIATEKAEALKPEAPKPDAPVVSFTDSKGHWAAKNIQQLVATGAASGYPDGSFRPNNNITRAEFATTVVKAFGLENGSGKVFEDTKNHWAKDYIATAQAHGIISGYSDTSFGPNDRITREQMASIIVKVAELEAVSGSRNFNDAKNISKWAVGAVETATANGILSGYPDGSFRPRGNATRAEAVTVIVKALNK